jgi:hypothetical protein
MCPYPPDLSKFRNKRRLPQNPGNDTVTFVYPGVTVDRLHKVQGTPSSQFTQTGCSMQPISVKDRVDNTQYSEATDRCFALSNANTLSVQAEWFAQFDGLNYRVLGVEPYRDSWGNPEYVGFICKAEKPV